MDNEMTRIHSHLYLPSRRLPVGHALGPLGGGGLWSPMGRAMKTTVAPWYLSGGVALANCVAAYQAIHAPDLATSYINLPHPGTYNAAPGAAPTFNAATGWTFNGITQYLTTGIIPQSGYSMIVQFSNVTGAIACLVGIRSIPDDARLQLYARNSGVGVVYGSGAAVLAIPEMTAGNICVAGQSGYRNGLLDIAAIGGWTKAANIAITIGARNWNGTIESWAAGNVFSLAIYSSTLTAAQVLAISTSMAAL